MQKNNVLLPTLSIASGAASSLTVTTGYAEEVLIQAPATLPETIKVEVALDEGSVYAIYQEVPGTDVTLAAGKCVRIKAQLGKFRLTSTGGNTAGQRDFFVRLVNP